MKKHPSGLAPLLLLPMLVAMACGSDAPSPTSNDASVDIISPGDSSGLSDISVAEDIPSSMDSLVLDNGSVDGSPQEDIASTDTHSEDAGTPTSIFAAIGVIPNPNNTLSALVTVETTSEVSVYVSFESEGLGPFQTGATEPGTSHMLTVVGMRQTRDYTLRIQANVDGDVHTAPDIVFTTGEVPGSIPEFEVMVTNEALVTPGITLFGLATATHDPNEPMYMGVDEAGEIVWYYNDVEADHDITNREARLLRDGRILVSIKNGFRLIDLAGNTLREIKGGPNVGSGLHHDVILLENNNFAALGTEQQTITVPELGGDVLLRGDTIVELDANNDVQWKWSAFDHLDTQSFPGQLAKKKKKKKGDHDWTHANALQSVDDGTALLMSLRHQHEVVKIDRATGEIMWRLGPFGDFELLDGEWFYAQHAPELYDDGRILIHDNGNERPNSPPYYSRGVMYQLDFEAMTATQLWSYTCPEYGSFLGDIDLLESGNILVTNGGIRLQGQGAPPGDGRILEVTQEPEPELVWELRAKEAFIYRSERISSFWPK